MSQPIKIAIVEDHELIRKSLSHILSEKGFLVMLEAPSGEEFLEHVGAKKIDVVLMDVNLGGIDGIETTRRLKARFPEIKVIALSVMDDDLNVIRMLRAGARAYVLKNCSPTELYTAISDVHSKGIHFSEAVSSSIIDVLYADPQKAHESTANHLSEKEISFLKLLCSEMTYKEIASTMFASPRTVEGWRNNLCDKLGLKSRVGLVLFATRNGIVS